MLDFTKVFFKGHYITDYKNYTEIIMLCTNIDFSHVCWIRLDYSFYNNEKCIFHIIDNILDVDAHDNNSQDYYTFFDKITHYSSSPYIMHYLANNGYISKRSFKSYCGDISCKHYDNFCKCCPHKHFGKLVKYITKISLNKFKGYYNIEKYYYMIYTMLLIIKTQQKFTNVDSTRKSLPNTVIKHLIIPFIYQ